MCIKGAPARPGDARDGEKGGMGFLSGKNLLITGLLNKRSIAYGVAKAAQREGASLAFTYQNERVRGAVESLAVQLGCDIVLPCDVSSDAQIAALLTLSYLGAERAVPHYNTMGLAKASLEAAIRYMAASLGPKGLRVNGISAGPIKKIGRAHV